jgi:aminoglycoside phosphotransferase (APT) family kinase protein
MTVDDDDLIAELAPRAQAAAEAWNPAARITSITPLTGGASSLTFTAMVDGVDGTDRVVLKVAPPGLMPLRNRDVLRQGRLMRGLHGRPGVAVPPVYFDDGGDPPDTPPFVAMGFVPGECIEPVLRDERDPDGFDDIRARALAAAVMLANVHAVDPVEAGLGDEPVVSIADEIDRWTRAFETLPPELAGDYVPIGERLHTAIPAPLPPVINHGDYRLGNTLSGDGRIHSIIDWEIFSVGDPRIDLTWFTFFTDEAHHPADRGGGPTGMPTPEELLEAYAEAGGAVLPDLEYFDALTRYKEAAATGLLIKRAQKRGVAGTTIVDMVPALPVLLREAGELLG